MSGINMIMDERARQIRVEGWTAEHDDQHAEKELATVAALYASPIILFARMDHSKRAVTFEEPWPFSWESTWDKRGKHDRIRQLQIAGALTCAEIDRLRRVDFYKKEFRPAELEPCGATVVHEYVLRRNTRWSPWADDQQTVGELAIAAALYVSPRPLFAMRDGGDQGVAFVDPWPWQTNNIYEADRNKWYGIVNLYDERKTRLELERLALAGALIAAEIDRLLRLKTT